MNRYLDGENPGAYFNDYHWQPVIRDDEGKAIWRDNAVFFWDEQPAYEYAQRVAARRFVAANPELRSLVFEESGFDD